MTTLFTIFQNFPSHLMPQTPPNIHALHFFVAAQGANIERKDDCCVHCVDVDSIGCDRSCDNAESDTTPLGSEGGNFAQKEEFISNTNTSRNFPSEPERKDSCLEAPPQGQVQINYDLSKSPSSSVLWLLYLYKLILKARNEYSNLCLLFLELLQNEPVDVVSDTDESMNGNSPSSPTSEIADDGGIFLEDS